MLKKSSSSNATTGAYKKAIELLGLNTNLAYALEMPDRELTVEVPFKRDNGELNSLLGFRVQHNNTRGPFKGGIRYHHRSCTDLRRRSCQTGRDQFHHIRYGISSGCRALRSCDQRGYR